MTEFLIKDINKLNINPFEYLGKKWAIVSAGDSNDCNGMTIAWGSMGVMWFKNVVNIVIRPQRYTKNFIDNNDYFSLSFFDENNRKELQYFGSVSGNSNKNKMKNSKLTTLFDAETNTHYLKEAKLFIICKKVFSSSFLK